MFRLVWWASWLVCGSSASLACSLSFHVSRHGNHVCFSRLRYTPPVNIVLLCTLSIFLLAPLSVVGPFDTQRYKNPPERTFARFSMLGSSLLAFSKHTPATSRFACCQYFAPYSFRTHACLVPRQRSVRLPCPCHCPCPALAAACPRSIFRLLSASLWGGQPRDQVLPVLLLHMRPVRACVHVLSASIRFTEPPSVLWQARCSHLSHEMLCSARSRGLGECRR